MRHSAYARRSALTLLVATAMYASSAESQVTLPFDTTGARRGESPRRYEYGPGMRWLAGDTVLTASVAVGYDRPGSEPKLTVALAGRDTSPSELRARPIAFGRCPVELRLFRDPERQHELWASSRSRTPCPEPKPARFGSGIDVDWPLTGLLRAPEAARPLYASFVVTLADGRRFHYESDVRPLFTGRRGTRDWSTLTYTSGIGLEGQGPRRMHGWTIVRNTGTQTVHVAHGACALNVRLWRDSAQHQLVWRSEARRPVEARRRPNMGYGCPMPLYLRELAPGDTLSFAELIPVGEIFQDTVPDGRYWTSVEIRLLDDSLRPPEWEKRKEFPTGWLTLRRNVDSLPSVRQIGAFRVESAVRVVPSRAGDSVKVIALVTNTSRHSATLQLVRGNPLTAYLYKDDGTRDVADLADPAYTIAGAHQFVPALFDLAPGEKWVFENAASARDIVAARGGGPFYITLWLMGNAQIQLSPGVIRLR